MAYRRRITIAAVCVTAAACGSTAPGPGPIGPSGPPPQIVCGAAVTTVGLGPTQPLSYAAPTVTSGVAPVTTTCTPASGSQFAVGATTVTCTATDAIGQAASCTLTARVNAPLVGVTTFQAVGDSLTQGQNGLPIQPSFIDEPNSYPTKLRGLLQGAFPGQGIVLTNRGVGGQFVGQTKEELPGYLAADRPEVVTLLAGYNDLTGPCHIGTTVADPACDAAVEHVEDTLRDCLRIIRQFSSVRYVFVSLLTPAGPVAPNAARDLRIDSTAIQAVNNRINTMAISEGAVVVNNYTPFLGKETEFVSIDGLHLRPAGYQSLADTFFARILATVPQTQPAAFLVR